MGGNEKNVLFFSDHMQAFAFSRHKKPDLSDSTSKQTRLPFKSIVTIHQAMGCQLLVVNARPACNKGTLIHDFIAEVTADLACITDTWMGQEVGIPLSETCPAGFPMQHQSGELWPRVKELKQGSSYETVSTSWFSSFT